MLDTDILVRDENGNTLMHTEIYGLPYEEWTVVSAHMSDSGTIVVTVRPRESRDPEQIAGRDDI